MFTSFTVTVAVRMDRASDELPRPRVALVPAPSYRLQDDRDHREVRDEPSFAVSLDLAPPLARPEEAVDYRVFDTTSQQVSLGGTVLLLDDALGSGPCQPRPARLRTEQDSGLRLPFDGWWVWPDFADDLTGEVAVTVLTSVRWTERGGQIRQAGVLVDFTLIALSPDD